MALTASKLIVKYADGKRSLEEVARLASTTERYVRKYLVQRGWTDKIPGYVARVKTRTESGVWANEALVASLVAHLESWTSASMIAEDLNAKFGVRLTRNAIIGKIHRLGLAHRIPVDANKGPRARSQNKKVRAPGSATPHRPRSSASRK